MRAIAAARRAPPTLTPAPASARRGRLVTPSEYAPPAAPTAEEQRAALRRGLGRAAMWAASGALSEAMLAEAWLEDWRYDRQIDAPRADWLFGLAESLGATARPRGPLLRSLGHLSDDRADERGAGQLCALAFLYAQAGDAVFRARLYDIVGRKPIAHSRHLGEREIVKLDGEAAFLFAARARGRLAEGRDGFWDDGELVFTAGELLGEDRAVALLDASADRDIARFRESWRADEREGAERRAAQLPYGEQMAALTTDDILAAAESPGPLRRHLGGWGRRADPADLEAVAARLWAATEPKAIARLLQVFSARALPEFDPRLIEFTTVEDTAHMVARVALDRSVRSGKFAFAGDRVSILDATSAIEAQTGRRFERRSLGSEADLRAAMAEAAKDKSNPFKVVMLAYQLYMLTGQTALSDLQNKRYPDVKLERFAEFAARALPEPANA